MAIHPASVRGGFPHTDPSSERRKISTGLTVLLLVILGAGLLAYSFFDMGEQTTMLMLGIGGFVIYVLTLSDVRIGLVVTMLAIGLSPEFMAFGIKNLRLEDFIVPIVFFGWITQVINKREEFAPVPIKRQLIAMVMFGAISTMIGIAFRGLAPMTGIFYFGKFLEVMMMFLLFVNNIKDEEDVRLFVVSVLAVSVLVGLFGATQSQVLAGREGFARVEGPEGETANTMGGYYVQHAMITLGCLVFAASAAMRVILFGVFGILMAPMLMSFSRTSYVAVAAGAAIFGMFKRRSLLIWMLFFLVIGAPLLPDNITERASTVMDVVDPAADTPASWDARVTGWKAYVSWKFFHQPLLGGGAGSIQPGAVDNEWVLTLLNFGTIGLLLLIAMFAILLRSANRVYDVPEDPLIKGYIAGYMGLIIAVMVHCIGSPSLTAIRSGEAFYVLTAIFCAIYHIYEDRIGKDGPNAPGPSEQVSTPWR